MIVSDSFRHFADCLPLKLRNLLKVLILEDSAQLGLRLGIELQCQLYVLFSHISQLKCWFVKKRQ